jgi:hypothetical protein
MKAKVVFGGCSIGDQSKTGTLTDELAKFQGQVVLITMGPRGVAPFVAEDIPQCHVFKLDPEEPETGEALDLLARWEDQRTKTIEPRTAQVVKFLITQAEAYQNAGLLNAAGDIKQAIQWISQKMPLDFPL